MLADRVLPFLFFMFGGAVPPASTPEVVLQSPPIECRERLGAWCILRLGAREVDVEYSQVDGLFIWRIGDPRWGNEEIAIREPKSCRTTFADSVDMVDGGAELGADGRHYQNLIISLRKDGTCDLRLRLSNDDKASYGWAFAPAIAAACFDEGPCEEGQIFRYIANKYNRLRRSIRKNAMR